MLIRHFATLLLLSLGGILFFNAYSPVHGGNLSVDTLDQKIAKIVAYGALAPSTHNAQMWRIKTVAADTIRLLLDDRHLLPQVDPQNRESMISLGAFIENMAEAAPFFGLQAEVLILTRDPHAREIAEIKFHPLTSPLLDKSVLNNIQNRHTIRTPYLRQALRQSDWQWLKTLGPDFHYFAVPGKEGAIIQTAIIAATKKQVANDAKQRELAGMFRFSKQEAERTKDGLTPEGMGLSGIAKWFVATFFNRDTVMTPSFRNQTVAVVKKQVNNCSGFLVLTAADSSVAALIDCGRNLERFLIMATGKKLAVHPMSAPLEENPWKETFSQPLALEQPVQMILRIGYVKNYGQSVSQRRPLEIAQ